MAYMARDQRRIAVLEAVIRIACAHGFAGATVRRVGQDIDIAAGNIHHLFASASELKRAAFRHFTEREMEAFEQQTRGLTPFERLMSCLSIPALDTDMDSHRLWTSAAEEASRDPLFAGEYAACAELWLQRIVDLLIAVTEQRMTRAQATDAAWRLMSFCVGVTSFTVPAELRLGPDQVIAHIRILVGNELRVVGAAGLEDARIDAPLAQLAD